ncbi:uncharacterized protein MAM_07970 [Metarhizium album ARSEF 1941]|uniref:Uncharacterized protein n=1 Tax=Metarhizium album (strain ARSEF 1941) TaxID=1081103 RepID=A0A0B2WM83_METAS|nr:uncharacterized protein MAM_07970 [Metarhizium album ARSEF 1941]KHN94130.1 hypothetical protein MAM_07970 [Metarhizium album ARSEF 1941]
MLLTGSVATFVRLYRVLGIGEQQRITATWMAWFMALGALAAFIMAPFFYVAAVKDQVQAAAALSELSMATVVVSNLTGLVTGGMYVLLRSSKIGKLGPKGYFEFDSRRLIGRPKSSIPPGFIFTRQMEQPVPVPRQLSFPERRASSLYPDGRPKTLAVGLATTTPGPVLSQETRTQKTSAYDMVPRDTVSDKPTYILPATAYIPFSKDEALNPFADEFLPPPAIRLSGGRRNRGSSLGSSASVPIGLRVSNIDDMPAVQSYYEAPPSPRPTPPSRLVSGAAAPQVSDGRDLPRDENSNQDKNKQLPPVPLALTGNPSVNEAEAEKVRLGTAAYNPHRTPSKTKAKIGSPNARPPGPSHSPESYLGVDKAEWI